MELVGPGARVVTAPLRTSTVPGLLAGLCDDAAVFPPGNAPLADAVAAHRVHATGWYADLVGPLVLPTAALEALPALLETALAVSLTVPLGPAGLPAALAAARALPIELRSVEVAVPPGMSAAELADRLAAAVPPGEPAAGPGDVAVFVEVPRDDRRDAVLAAVRDGGHRAKFRTGGVRADLYPDEAELAASLAAAIAAGVAFKATAGLHHAVRNTDPATGFEQHGFLNLLLAAEARAGGGTEDDARALLAERDPATVAALVRALPPGGRRSGFVSFGTCSVTDPLDDLVALGLLAVPR